MRVFFAIRIGPPADAALEALAARLARETGGRAVARANLHLTLAFVGDVDPGRLDALLAAGARAASAAACGPLRLRLDGLGRFAGARVAWVAPTVRHEPLAALARALVATCAHAGLPCDARPFAPHVTLVRGARRDPCGVVVPVELQAAAFELMHSRATPVGVAYDRLASFTLAACERAG